MRQEAFDQEEPTQRHHTELPRDTPLQNRVNTDHSPPGGSPGPCAASTMLPLLFCVLLGAAVAPVKSERHSLTYIYTALSKPVTNPGIHEFTAMGLLDTKMIDYFDSDEQQKVPKQAWMRENLGMDYWEKGTQSRKSKQQWFKVNLDILRERKNQTDDDIHVLQWMHGCDAEVADDGKLQFVRGIDQYSYDGESFLYFDDTHSVWVAAATEAKPTKRKWDDVQVLKDYTKGYLEKECLDWLGKFMNYGKQQLIHAKPPEVYLFASPARQKSSVRLNCLATGFYPPDIIINLLRDGLLVKEDIITTGIRPNHDDTYQRRDSIEILRTDKGQYSCEVIHAATSLNIQKKWDGELPPHGDEVQGFPIGPVVGGIIGVVVLIGLIVGVVLFKKRQEQPKDDSGCLNSVGGSGDSTNSGSLQSLKNDSHKTSQDSALGSTGSEETTVNVPLMASAGETQ